MAEPTAPTPRTVTAKFSLCETCQELIGDFTTRIEPEHTTPQHCIKALVRRVQSLERVHPFAAPEHRVIGTPEDGGVRG